MEIAQITTVLFTVLYLLESLANIKLRRENRTNNGHSSTN